MARMPTPAKYSAGPGDLIAFSGADLVSDVINLATWGWPRWGASHVAIVTDDPEFGVCLAESTTLADRPCLIGGERVSGAQLHPLAERVDEYRGRVWRYPLRVPLGVPLIRALNRYLIGLVEAHCGYDYIGAIRSRTTLYAIIHRLKHGRENLDTLFCSELVAAAWDKFDLWGTTNASGWNPNALIRAALRDGTLATPCRWK